MNKEKENRMIFFVQKLSKTYSFLLLKQKGEQRENICKYLVIFGIQINSSLSKAQCGH